MDIIDLAFVNSEVTGASPMLCLIYVIFIIVALYYASNQTCPRMAAAGAALRQVWSGGCQSCRTSEVSGLSGLPQSDPQASPQGASEVREACVCDVCPCRAIDAVVRTASPVANIFDDTVTMLNHVYCHILASFVETYEMVNRVLECRTVCRHQAQIVNESQFDSLDNFSFGQRKPSTVSKRLSISLREEDINRSATSSRQTHSLKAKAQSLLRLFEKIGSKETEAKEKPSSNFSENIISAAISAEIEATVAVERTPKVATKEKGIDMHLDEESYGTEEKGVGVHPDEENEPSSSHQGTGHSSDRSWKRKAKGFFQISDGKKPESSVEPQAYCEKCQEGGKLCVPSCPKNPNPMK